jgi:putative Holliday junction resolvase
MSEGSALGFDVGAKRIGVAVGHSLTGAGRDLCVLEVRGAAGDFHDFDFAALDRAVADYTPVVLVVGDPKLLDDEEAVQPARRRARAFAHALATRYRLPVRMVDERRSSLEAAGRFAQARAAGTRRRAGAEKLDALAAAVILDRWFADPGAGTAP